MKKTYNSFKLNFAFFSSLSYLFIYSIIRLFSCKIANYNFCLFFINIIYSMIPYHRRQWTEFNVPMMLGGCGSLGIILIIFIVTIYNYFQLRNKNVIEVVCEDKDEGGVRKNENKLKEKKEDERGGKDNEKINQTISEGKKTKVMEEEKDDEIMQKGHENKEMNANELRNKILNLFGIMRRSVYLTTVLLLSLFHAVSSFSNSFIIEVCMCVCVCVCVCLCVRLCVCICVCL